MNGGGIYAPNNIVLYNTTVSGNSASYGGGIQAGNVGLYNSILAGNSAPMAGADCYATISAYHSIIRNMSGCTVSGNEGNQFNVNPKLGTFLPAKGYHPLEAGSPAINAGDPAYCQPTDQRGLARVGTCDIGAYEYPQTPVSATMSFYSTANEDGHILESSETSNKGGSKNNTSTMLYIGDNAANKQYRSIVSFDTFNLPTDIVITAVTLKFKYAGKSGSLPFNTHGKLLADVKQGSFNDNPALELADFKAAASKNAVLSFTNTLDVGGFYSQTFDPSNFQYINRNAPTQFKLRFAKDDNNDFGADYLKIYSGGSIPGTQPELVIGYTYYVR